ncbi:hypothetical protein TNCT6_66650 [Streptomyces sp. 6-11-2]|nr:hypothetical protein TNCT6_66650 [Streptomyces sp. 6-11-2]
MPPERLRMDQRPRHPWLVLRVPDGREGTVRDSQGRLSEARATTGREAETRATARITLQEDEGNSSPAENPRSVSDQERPKAHGGARDLVTHGQGSSRYSVT